MEMPQPKFTLGQKVKFFQDNDGEAGLVIAFSYDAERGYTYKISSRELDIPNKQISEGFKHCLESELVAINENAPAQPESTQENPEGE